MAAVLVSVYTYDFFASLITISSSVLISALYFKLQFKQINADFNAVSGGRLPASELLKLMALHNTMIVEVNRFDSENSYYLYVLVKLIKPAFNTFVYLLFEPHSEWHFLIYVGFTVAVNSLFFVGITHLFASITRYAHRPQFASYGLLLARIHNQNTSRMSITVRYKIMRFIERLSGRVIGFYCLDLFPFTTYQFTDYILDSMVSFLLIVKFLKRLNLI